MPGFCLHLISFQLLIGWQRLWSFLLLFSSFLNSSILRPSWWIFEMYFVWFFLCFWPSFQIIFTFPASAGWVKCEEFWSNEMVDKSMWFFFLLFHPFIHSSFIVLWFFFRLDFKKNCSFKSSFVDFFFVKLQVFVYFSLMRGILMISSYLLMFFRFLHLRGQIVEIFHCLFLVNDVCWGRSWGWRVVRDVYVRDNFRAMYRKTSWNIFQCFSCTWFYWVLGDDCCWSCMNL